MYLFHRVDDVRLLWLPVQDVCVDIGGCDKLLYGKRSFLMEKGDAYNSYIWS